MNRLPQHGERNWGTKLNEFLLVAHHENGELRHNYHLTNVRDFGAKGDGSSDDTDALQQAIMAAAGGGTLFIPAGVYSTRKLLLPSHIIICGEGSSSVLKLRDGTMDALFTNMDWTNGNEQITLRNLGLDGNRTQNMQVGMQFFVSSSADQDKSHGVNFHFVQDALLENLTIANFYYDGVYLGTSTPDHFPNDAVDPSSGSNRNMVRQNRILRNGRNGISITRGTDNIIEGNLLRDNNIGLLDADPAPFRAGAITIEPNGDWYDVSRNLIQGNQLLHNYYNGIQVLKNWQSSGILISANTLSLSGRHGIAAALVSGLIIQGNHITGSVEAGMALGQGTGVKDAVVSANIVAQNGSTGILVNGAQGERIIVTANIAVGNAQTNPQGSGIVWVESQEVTLMGNVCLDNGPVGAAQMLAYGADPIFLANRVERMGIPAENRIVKGGDIFASLWRLSGDDQSLFLGNQRTGKTYSLPIEEIT